MIISIYTDAATHHHTNRGAWAALIITATQKILLKNIVTDTTNNRLELQAVLEAIHYLKKENMLYQNLLVHTDSQYVIRIAARKERLQAQQFCNKLGQPLPNADLLKTMVTCLETQPLEFIKIVAHLKKTDANPHHRTVDKLVRKMMRNADHQE